MQWMKVLNNVGVIYLKVNSYEEQCTIRRRFINSALYNDMKIKTTTGCWINPETCETEKVMKVELLSEPKKRLRKKPKIDERDLYITNCLYEHDGMTLVEIAERYHLTKQRVSQIIRRVKEFQEEEEENNEIC